MLYNDALMLPILWRYLLRSYFQVFALCVSGFIAVLLVTRFQEIARFASSGAGIGHILLFTLYQTPYILPIAIPISCLIAAMLLSQRLSHTHELTALRAAGIGLYTIVFPLLLAGFSLSLLNFSITSEITPRFRTRSRALVYEMTAKNPLFILQKETLVRLKEAYIDMHSLKAGKHAKDVVFVIDNASSKRLGIMTAEELDVDGEMLTGKNVTLISSVDTKREGGFDHLVIENQKTMTTKASNLAQFVEKYESYTNYDYFPLRLIMAKEKVEGRGAIFPLSRAQMEIAKRLSMSLAAFSFTFVGMAFGMQIGRKHSKKGLLWAIGLTAAYMIAFVSAKSFKNTPALACLIYLVPHPLIILLSLRSLKRTREGRT